MIPKINIPLKDKYTIKTHLLKMHFLLSIFRVHEFSTILGGIITALTLVTAELGESPRLAVLPQSSALIAPQVAAASGGGCHYT